MLTRFRIPPHNSGCFVPPDAKYRGKETVKLRKKLKIDNWPEREAEREIENQLWSMDITSGIKRLVFLFIHKEVNTKEFKVLLWSELGTQKVSKELEAWFWSLIEYHSFNWNSQMKITRTPQFKKRVALYRELLKEGKLPEGWERNSLDPNFIDKERTRVHHGDYEDLADSLWIVPLSILMFLLPVPRHTETFENIYTKIYMLFNKIRLMGYPKRVPWKVHTDLSQTIDDCKDEAQAMAWADTVKQLNLPYGYRE